MGNISKLNRKKKPQKNCRLRQNPGFYYHALNNISYFNILLKVSLERLFFTNSSKLIKTDHYKFIKIRLRSPINFDFKVNYLIFSAAPIT
jgi:hypothetical protein